MKNYTDIVSSWCTNYTDIVRRNAEQITQIFCGLTNYINSAGQITQIITQILFLGAGQLQRHCVFVQDKFHRC